MSEQVNLEGVRRKLLNGLKKKGAKPVLYDLGCGQNRRDGFTGLDLFASGDGVRKCNLYEFPWRVDGTEIEPESVDYLYASHFIEHIPDWDGFFSEVYRVLKTGGYFEILSPYYTSVRAWQDPDHKQAISEARFAYLNQKWCKSVRVDHYGARVNFDVHRGLWFYAWQEDYVGREESVREFAKAHSLNVVDDIACILVKLPLE